MITNPARLPSQVPAPPAKTGLATVAIHSADDALSLHVRAADEQRPCEIPGQGARAYLDIEQ